MDEHELIVLRALEITGTASEIEIAYEGEWKGYEGGPFRLDRASFERIVARFEAEHADVPIDYEHRTITGEEARAAGWVKALRIGAKQLDGRELVALFATVEWVERAAAFIKAREYRYVSPIIQRNATDRETGQKIGPRLHSVALTNTPFLDGIAPLVLRLDGAAAAAFRGASEARRDGVESAAPHGAASRNGIGRASMGSAHGDTHEEPAMNELEQKVRALLNAPAAADEKTLLAGLEALAAERANGSAAIALKAKVTQALALGEGADGAAIVAKIGELARAPGESVPKADFVALKARFDALDAKELEGEVDAAVRAGKLLPPQREWALGYARQDREGFRAFIAKQPVVGPVGEVAGGAAPAAARDTDAIIAKYQTDHKTSYRDALCAVSKAHPELFATEKEAR